MAVIALSKAEMQSIQKIGSMLTGLSKIIGEDQLNEFKLYDEIEAEKAADNLQLASKLTQVKQLSKNLFKSLYFKFAVTA